MTLSNKEQELYDLIKANPNGLTAKQIEEKLSASHVGAMGRLIGHDVVIKTKVKDKQIISGYGNVIKLKTVYKIPEDKNKQ